MRTVVHAKSKPLALKADDAWTSRPDHLDPGTIIEPHLPQAMDHIARAQDFSDAPPLSCAESTERNKISLSFRRSRLTRCFHAWDSRNFEGPWLWGGLTIEILSTCDSARP